MLMVMVSMMKTTFFLPVPLLWQRPNNTDESLTATRLRDEEVPEIFSNFFGFRGYFSYIEIAEMGDIEATVLCKSLGFEGLEQVILSEDYGDDDGYVPYYSDSRLKFSCQGNETRLEDCEEIKLNDSMPVNKVRCRGEQQLGSLHLVGGKDSSAGDIIFGDKGLGCTPYRYSKEFEQLSEVICRELGFLGFIKTTRRSAFTTDIFPRYELLEKIFLCSGAEQKVSECTQIDTNEQPYHDQDCGGEVRGIVCKTDTRKGVEDGLADLLDIFGWKWMDLEIEKIVRLFFITDSNGDGRLTQNEIAAKVNTYVYRILSFLDQTQDGHISIHDLTSLNIKVESIHKILELTFDVIANKTTDEIDPLNMNIAGIRVDELFGYYLRRHDENEDGKLNALDFIDWHRSRSKLNYLLPFLNMKLDRNQDGKIQRSELNKFVNEMFRELDSERSGDITFGDVYRLMREHGFDCFQVGALKTYVTIILDIAKTQFEKLMSYLFREFDIDENERVSLEEFQKMTLPCDIERSYPYNPDRSDKYECYRMLEEFFGAFAQVRFPDLEMKSRRRNRYDDHRPREENEETLMDKLTNAACEILT